MQDIDKSTLLGHQFRLVGLTYDKNPLDSSRAMQMTFYQRQGKSLLFVICASDIAKRDQETFRTNGLPWLGRVVDAEAVIPYAARGLADVSYDEFKKAMEECYKGIPIDWWTEG